LARRRSGRPGGPGGRLGGRGGGGNHAAMDAFVGARLTGDLGPSPIDLLRRYRRNLELSFLGGFAETEIAGHHAASKAMASTWFTSVAKAAALDLAPSRPLTFSGSSSASVASRSNTARKAGRSRRLVFRTFTWPSARAA